MPKDQVKVEAEVFKSVHKFYADSPVSPVSLAAA